MRALGSTLTCALLAGLIASGCLFDTREPVGTGPGEQVEWVTPETMGNALGNMRRSLEAGVLTNYGRSFSPSELEMWLSTADADELGEQNPLESWNANQEEQRMSGILGSTEATLTVKWTVSDSIDESQSLRYYEDLGYELTFEKSDSIAVYSGTVELWFKDDGTGQWFIVKWVDKRDATDRRTWGWLRMSNRVEFEAS